MPSQVVLTSRPRLHNANATLSPPRHRLSSRSRWLQDVTGMREGDRREPPPPSAEERLQELKEQVFKNRYHHEPTGGRTVPKTQYYHHSEDPSTINTLATSNKHKQSEASTVESCPNTKKPEGKREHRNARSKSPNKRSHAIASPVGPSSYGFSEQQQRVHPTKHAQKKHLDEKREDPSRSPSKRRTASPSTVDPHSSGVVKQQKRNNATNVETPREESALVEQSFTPRGYNVAQNVPSSQPERQVEALKSSQEVKQVEPTSDQATEKAEAIPPLVASSQRGEPQEAVPKKGKMGKIKQIKQIKPTSWLRRTIAVLDASRHLAETVISSKVRDLEPLAPPRYVHETSPLQQQLWLTEIQKAFNEVRVAEEMMREEAQEWDSLPPVPVRESSLSNEGDVTVLAQRTASDKNGGPAPARLPDYYADERAGERGSIEDDDEDSISSIQVLINWFCSDAPTTPMRLNTRRGSVTATE